MKVKLNFKLPEITIQTDTGHGCVERVLVNGKDFADIATVDFVLEVLGHGTINDALALEQDRISRENQHGPE